MASNYTLRITAGPDYDTAGHVEVPVNRPQPVHIKSDRADLELNVRVKNYVGLPRDAPATSPYFEAGTHDYNQDQYSICFRFTPKAPPPNADADAEADAEADGVGNGADRPPGISGHDLQFGNDFARPIRHLLPPGFNAAMRIVKWWIDPGLEGDAYADMPYLYGPALSSVNALHVGMGEFDEDKGGIWVEEGGDAEIRHDAGMPDDARARMKWALADGAKGAWVFEYGRTYAIDFFNPYLDFSNLSLCLPGFKLPILGYWDSQGIQYVLRNKTTEETYLVVCFTLHLNEDVAEDGTILRDAESWRQDEKAAADEATKKGVASETEHLPRETADDDVD